MTRYICYHCGLAIAYPGKCVRCGGGEFCAVEDQQAKGKPRDEERGGTRGKDDPG